MTNPNPMSKYVRIDVSPARLTRVWARTSAQLALQPSRLPRRGWLLAAMAICVVGVAVGTWRMNGWQSTPSILQKATLETAGDSLRFHLDDGTDLELAARSRLEVLSGDQRQITAVRLHRGRILCDLQPKPNRRFSVYAGNVEVRVTGTRFRVMHDSVENGVEVEVERGSVRVSESNGQEQGRTLVAGERWSRRGTARPGPAVGPASSASASSEPIPQSPTVSALQASAQVANHAGSTTTINPQRGEAASPDPPEPSAAATLFDQANSARRVGDSATAARAYQALLTQYPNDSRADLAAFELGRLRMSALGDVSGAIRAFQSAIGHAHSATLREDALARLVEAYAKSGQTARCKALRDQYLGSYPKGVHVSLVARQCGSE